MMLMTGTMSHARVTYVRLLWEEGISHKEYVFRYDDDGIARMYDESRYERQVKPCVPASDTFIKDLEELIEKGDVFSYAPKYEPEEMLRGGYEWALSVETDDGRSVYSTGHSVEPPGSIVRGLELLMWSYISKAQ